MKKSENQKKISTEKLNDEIERDRPEHSDTTRFLNKKRKKKEEKEKYLAPCSGSIHSVKFHT